MANWEQIKTASDVKLEGVSLELERLESRLHAVTLRDTKGNAVRFVTDSYYSGIGAFIPAKPKTETRFALVGDLKGIKVDELFESRFAAANRMTELAAAVDDCKFEIVEREVEVPQ